MWGDDCLRLCVWYEELIEWDCVCGVGRFLAETVIWRAN